MKVLKSWKEANLKSDFHDDRFQVHIRIQANYSYFLWHEQILTEQSLPDRVIPFVN